jgi:hypothetical protein
MFIEYGNVTGIYLLTNTQSRASSASLASPDVDGRLSFFAQLRERIGIIAVAGCHIEQGGEVFQRDNPLLLTVRYWTGTYGGKYQYGTVLRTTIPPPV